MQTFAGWVGILVTGALVTGCGVLSPFEQDASLAGYTKLQIASARSPAAESLAENLQDPGGILHAFSTPMTGGIMVYAQKTDGSAATNLYYTSDTDSTTFSLPNGTYNFYAVGYPTTNLGGTPQCGIGTDGTSTTVSLSGGSKTISIAMSNQVGVGCDQAAFGPSAFDSGTGSPEQLNLYTCSSAGFSGVSTYTSTCTGNLGVVASVRIYLAQLDTSGNPVTSPMVSICTSFTGGISNTGLPIPAGSATGANMAMIIKTYSDNACGTTAGDFLFPLGYANLSTSARYSLNGTTSNATTMLKVFTQGPSSPNEIFFNL